MPRPISDEELQLKKRARRRLVGAIVLVSAVAVILPMVLDSEPRPVSQNVDIQIPSPNSGEFKPKSGAAVTGKAADTAGTPAKAAPAAATASGATGKAAAVGESKAPTAVQSGPPLKGMPPVAAASKEPAQKPAEASAEPKSATDDKSKDDTRTAAAKDGTKASSKDLAASGAYVVQVAALADAARVKQLQKQMSAAGVKAYTEAITTKSGEVTRVRAGPYATKEAAETARTQLKKVGLDGKVVPK